MKNATKKKTARKKKSAPAQERAKKKTSAAQPEDVQAQPQSKQQAAKQAGVFLHTDDKWSLAYFDSNDLHCVERELFG